MILKGSQRGNGADLAIHLMNGFDNESVEIAQVQGAVAEDLFGAFAEFEAVAAGTKAKKPLYSLSINPPSPLTRAQYLESIAAIEDRLGLAGQPRAIVFHMKDGREHCHVVWSRTDVETMRAIHLAHDRRKLMDLACDLAKKHGLALPPGLKAWEERRQHKKDKLEPTLAEKSQADATGVSPEQRRMDITACFAQSDGAEAFVNALEQHGYVLARGNRRGFVVVDEFGNVHSLSRYIEGHSAKAIRARLAPLTPEQLPSVDQARETMRQRAQAKAEQDREADQDALRQYAQERRRTQSARLAGKQGERRARLAGREQDLLVRQAAERLALHAAQKLESDGVLFRVRRAVAEFIDRTPGLRSVLGPIQKFAGLDPLQRHALERAALARRHAREKLEIDRHKRALTRLENRERASLEKRLRQAEAQERALAMEAERNLREEADRQVIEQAREFEDGELSATFNDSSFDPKDPPNSGGEGDDGPGHGHKPNGPGSGHRRRRKKGYGYRRE